jgi:ATP-dependent exoDNAse (exonuclease V) beta subunit
MTASEIKNQWNSSGKEASEAGTAMHLGIEMFHNDANVDDSIKESVEWKYFQNYWKECGEDLEPYRTEWEVWSEEHKLAGSIDMIYRRKSDGKFIIYDWKRSKEIKTTNTFENGYAPLDHLPNCNYWHYTLQLNVYKWFLETFYGLEVAELYLIILHPDNNNYRRLRLNILPNEVQEMLNCRKRAVEAGSKSLVLLPIDT